MTVHVMGSNDEPIEEDESVCTARFPGGLGTRVVFHPASIRVGEHWLCEVCGEGVHRNGEAS